MSYKTASFTAKAIGFPVTLDFQYALQAQSCQCMPKGLMSVLVTRQTKIIRILIYISFSPLLFMSMIYAFLEVKAPYTFKWVGGHTYSNTDLM